MYDYSFVLTSYFLISIVLFSILFLIFEVSICVKLNFFQTQFYDNKNLKTLCEEYVFSKRFYIV